MKSLGQIAICLNGFTFRTKPSDDPKGDTRVIQVGDIQLNGSLDMSVSPRIKHEIC